MLSISELQTIARKNAFIVKRNEVQIIRDLDCYPKVGLFGEHLLVSTEKAKEKEEKKARPIINIPLSPREKRIIERLDSTE